MKNTPILSLSFFLVLVKIIRNILAYPLLVLHELLHYIFGFLLGLRPNRLLLTSPFEEEIGGLVNYNNFSEETKWQSTITSLAPFSILIFAIILSVNYTYAIYFLLYVVLFYDYSFPSRGDWVNVFLFEEKRKVSEWAIIDECGLNNEFDEYINSISRIDIILNYKEIAKKFNKKYNKAENEIIKEYFQKYFKTKLAELTKIEIKEPLPQVGSYKLNYKGIKDDTLYDFIINEEGEFLVGKGHYKLNNKRHFLYFAGQVKMRDEKIIYINNNSGHYSPSLIDLAAFSKALFHCEFVDEEFIVEDKSNSEENSLKVRFKTN